MEKIIITVVKLNGQLYFLFKYRGKKIYFLKLIAYGNYFDAFSKNSILVLRNKKDFDTGYVSYAGGHGAQEWFFGFKKIIPKDKHTKYLSALPPTIDNLEVSFFKESDVLQIKSNISNIRFFNALAVITWPKKDSDEAEQYEKLEKEKEIAIESKHQKNEKVRKMLLQRLWNKSAKLRSERIEKRKELSVIIEKG